jgi:hypothetical protein
VIEVAARHLDGRNQVTERFPVAEKGEWMPADRAWMRATTVFSGSFRANRYQACNFTDPLKGNHLQEKSHT